MGQQKLRKVRYTNTQLKKIPKRISEPETLPGSNNSYPKVARGAKPRNAVIRYQQRFGTSTFPNLTKTFERPKLLPLPSTNVKSQVGSVGSSHNARSLQTYSEIEFKYNVKTKPGAIKTNKLNHPKSTKPGDIATKRPTENSYKDLEFLPKRLQYHRTEDQKLITNSKKIPTVKPALSQFRSTPSKANRSVEVKKRDLINKSIRIPMQYKSPDILQAKSRINEPKQSFNSKYKQRKTRKIPESKSYDIPKGKTDFDYPGHIGVREQWLDHIEVSHSLPQCPGKLRSILKNSMNYSQIKKLDDESLELITEGKGPVDECLCHLLTPSEHKERGIKASIKRAFASFSGSKKKGLGGQNSVDIPISFTQGGKGGIYSTKEELKRKSPCGRCGCDKRPLIMKHSYANIRITSPDLSTICSCPEDCFPDKDKYNGKVRVTVERMALNSDDSELSLQKRSQQLVIPEPMMDAVMDDVSISERSEWSSGN